MLPTVSVVIPLYNRIHLIGATLSSLNQTLHPNVVLEIIVVDDGSTDGSGDWVRVNYPQIKFFEQVNQGAPTARNLGLANSNGEFILFLDSDDLIEPDFFSAKLNALLNNHEIAGAYGLWEHFEEMNNGELVIHPRHAAYPIIQSPNWEKHLALLLSGWFIVPHAILWRSSVILEIGGFNPKLSINQDVDLLFNILSNKKTIIGVKSPKALYRVHSSDRVGQINSQPKLEDIFNLRIQFKNVLDTADLWSDEIKQAFSSYCLGLWVDYRTTYPLIALQFYKLSKTVCPNLKLRGGFVFSILQTIFGMVLAIKIKYFLRNSNKHVWSYRNNTV